MRALGLIEDGALLIVDGIIRHVGSSRRVENLAEARDAVELGAEGRLVMPGFVDCRTQLVSGPSLLTQYEQTIGGEQPVENAALGVDMSLVEAIRNSSRPRLAMLARKTLRQFVRHGTTALDVHSGLGLDDKSELKMLRAVDAVQQRPLDVSPTFYGAAGLPPQWHGTADDYIDHLIEFTLPKIRRLKLAQSVDIRMGPAGFTPFQVSRFLSGARQLGFTGRVTACEWEPDEGVRVAAEAGARSVDHLECMTDRDIGLAASSNLVATLMPGASFHRRRQTYAPARQLIDAGAAVAIASGYSSDRCPTANMGAVVSLACNLMRMTPAEAIAAATINAAHVAGFGDHAGSLESGKRADLIMLSIADYREIPYHFAMNLVAMMMKQGDVVYPRMESSWPST